jgi:hypothetical protein
MPFGASHQILHLSTIDANLIAETHVFKTWILYGKAWTYAKAIGYSPGLHQHL